MKLTSPAFEQNQPIPVKHTCDGANHHPPLNFSQVPEEAQSLALVVEDPDAPTKVFPQRYGRGKRFWHTWLSRTMPSFGYTPLCL